jgi:putative nucleotidyltransferase-like protein
VTPTPYAEERFLLAALRRRDPPPTPELSARRLLELCDWHGVGPLLARALEGRDLPPPLEQDLRPGLRQRLRRTGLENALLLDRFARFGELLEGAGVDFVLLKGASLIPLVYGGAEERPLADVDLLIRRQDWPRVREAAAASRRYRLPSPERERICLRYLYATELETDEASGSHFELHWNLELGERTALRPEDLIARSVPVSLDGREYRRLGDLDLALHLALHAAHHFFAPRLIWMHDLARLAESGRIDWPRLAAAAAQCQARAALGYTLWYLEKAYPGTVPPRADLPRTPPGRIRRGLFARASTPNPLLPTRDLMPLPGRWLYSLLLIDRPADMARLSMAQAWRKLFLRLPAA